MNFFLLSFYLTNFPPKADYYLQRAMHPMLLTWLCRLACTSIANIDDRRNRIRQGLSKPPAYLNMCACLPCLSYSQLVHLLTHLHTWSTYFPPPPWRGTSKHR